MKALKLYKGKTEKAQIYENGMQSIQSCYSISDHITNILLEEACKQKQGNMKTRCFCDAV